jgi:hypothetical protein
VDAPRVLVSLGTRGWREWIRPFLEGPGYVVDCVVPDEVGDDLVRAARRRPYAVALFLSRHGTLARDAVFAARLAAEGVPLVAVQPDLVVRLARDKRAMGQRAVPLRGILPIPESSGSATSLRR